MAYCPKLRGHQSTRCAQIGDGTLPLCDVQQCYVACLSDGQLFGLASGSAATEERDAGYAHIDECVACRRLVAEIARSIHHSEGRVETAFPPREITEPAAPHAGVTAALVAGPPCANVT